MSAYVRSRDIIERLKLEMPVQVTLPDPWTGAPFEVRRDNYLAILTLDFENLPFEGQSLAAFYAEAGRAARAATYQSELAEIQYRKWKAQRAAECADKMPEKKTASGKPAAKQGPTKDEIEQFYRTHEDYEAVASAAARYRALAGLFEDVRKGFELKQRTHETSQRMSGSYERVIDAEGRLDRMDEIENLEREAAEVIANSGAAEAAAIAAKNGKTKAPRAV